MYCVRCGKYNPDHMNKCGYCGGQLSETKPNVNNESATNHLYGESKTVVGVLLCLFLSVIGLVIGLLLYTSDTYERSSMLKGWLKCFIVQIVLGVIIGCVSVCAIMSMV